MLTLIQKLHTLRMGSLRLPKELREKRIEELGRRAEQRLPLFGAT